MAVPTPLPRTRVRIPCRALLLAFCLVGFAAGARAHTQPSAADASDGGAKASRSLPLKTRQEIFEKIWKEIHEDYYDPAFNGVNWDDIRSQYRPRVAATTNDQEFYTLMSEMTAELHDAHTRFSSPQQWKNFRRQQRVSAGFSVDDVDGKSVVISVRPESSAARAGIEPGMVLVSVDGQQIEERVAEIEKKTSR